MKLTPGMKQYMDAKARYPDCIMLFRMGDFYETFFDDAVTISKVLNVTLTSRGKGETRAPLAGIPYHSIDKYIPQLIAAGYKVAMCEQIEDPKKAVGLVKRDVVRVITPGTVVEDSMLDKTANNFFGSIFGDGQNFGLAFIDVSTGDFYCTEVTSLEAVFHELARKKTAEVISNTSKEKLREFCENQNIYFNDVPDQQFWLPNATTRITTQFKKIPDAVGFKDSEYALCAAGALLTQLHETQKQSLEYVKAPKFSETSEFMSIDASTIKNLELLKNIHNSSSKGSLLSILDKTKTAMGGRKLKMWITHPLLSKKDIDDRLTAVEVLSKNIMVRDELRESLAQVFDIERLVSKISYRLTSPRDLVTLKNSLHQLPQVRLILESLDSPLLQSLADFPDTNTLTQTINAAIADESEGSEVVRGGAGYSSGGSGRREIGIIKKGFNAELDELYALKFNTKVSIQQLESVEKEKTGMALKVGYNKVFGYYIEVTNKHKDNVPGHYIRKQTLSTGERFITEELKIFEEKLVNAEAKLIVIEDQIIHDMQAMVANATPVLQEVSDKLASIDVLASFGTIAYENNYKRPKISNSDILRLQESRHPVIEKLESTFIPNDCTLDVNDTFLMLITGPNMAGKSTYMRQIALIILMAQVGSFVPCASAEIGVVDKIFSRVGAYDDLSMGQSTFMVEMLETANILREATSRSFIILDEIGRGTSTFDGVAIAWSVAEYILQSIKAKTLFATHYHVLTHLEENHAGIGNFHIAVDEKDDEIVFLRKIKAGGTDKSFGVQVARLAGLPQEVIANAKRMQEKLEKDSKLRQSVVVPKPEPDQKTLEF